MVQSMESGVERVWLDRKKFHTMVTPPPSETIPFFVETLPKSRIFWLKISLQMMQLIIKLFILKLKHMSVDILTPLPN